MIPKPLRKPFASIGVFTLGAFLFAAPHTSIAQGPPGHDPYNPPPGHGGVPPGQAKKYDKHNNGKYDKHNNDWRFREDDRSHFYGYYRNDVNHWHGKKRPVIVRGQALPPAYYVQPMPQAYWQSVPPPPPGYQYGYYDGYAVAYNPTTRIVADVLDLVTAAATR